MPIEPVDDDMREAVKTFLAAFSYEVKGHDTRLFHILNESYSEYKFTTLRDDAHLYSMLNCPDLNMMEQNHYVILEPTESKDILPFVTLHSSGDWDNFRIYALLATLDDNSNLQSLAIRFETDEGGRRQESKLGMHDFCHAQLCKVIKGRVKASTPPWLPDSQPSIPLDAGNQASLVLCMLVSLYGGKCVAKRFTGHRKKFAKYLDDVRALKHAEDSV